MITAGIGASASATAAEITEAVRDACGRAGIEPNEVGILASLARPETQLALSVAAEALGADVEFQDVGQLSAQSQRCVTHSERSMAATGVPSVAEAAALAASGPDGMLILPRVAYATVTVALAVGPGATSA